MFRKINGLLEKKIIGKFEIDENVLRDFCTENTEQWNDQKEAKPEDGCIFIGLFMVEKWVSWMESKILCAKGIEEKTGKKPMVIDWEYNEQLEAFFASYGIGFLSIKKEMFKNPAGFLYGLFQAVCFWVFGGTGAKMIQKKYKGIHAGSFMYDTIIRTNQDIYTVRNARTKICFKKVLTTYWLLHSLHRVCKTYRPSYYIFDDLVYDEGMICEYMKKQGGKAAGCTIDSRIQLPDYTEGMIFWPDFDKYVMEKKFRSMSEEEKNRYVEMADEALKNRFLGKNGDVRDSKAAFTGKKDASREELVSVMGLDPKKKNVVFCSHTFSESAHRCSRQAYQDTYTWMEETMKHVRGNDNANWIIKVHPIAAKKYGEVNVLENLYKKYKSENLYWFPDEYNSALVGQLADVVVTIYGNAGSEYSCLGIPVILAGNAVYSGMGYTVDAFTAEAYEKALDRVNEIGTLSEEQKNTAKLVFAYLNGKTNQNLDDFGQKMVEWNWKFDTVFMDGQSVKNLNTETLNYIREYGSREDVRKTDYYKAGLEIGN